MFSDLLDDDDDDLLAGLSPTIFTKSMINNYGNTNHNINPNTNSASTVMLMQPKLDSQPTIQTKMVPIAPRCDPNQQNSTLHTCTNCNQPIYERYFLHTQDRLSRGNYWHMQCLRCQCCDVVLADIASTFYTKDNALLCKSDYLKKYGSRPCSLCSQVIGTNEQIMRVNSNYVYHLSCFNCVKCHTHLVKGDRYVLFNGQLFCEKDNPLKSTTNTSVTKRGTTTSKRGAKTSRAASTNSTTQIQQTFVTPPTQYHPTGHISLLNNPHHTSTIIHPLSNNNNNNSSSLIATPSGDDIY